MFFSDSQLVADKVTVIKCKVCLATCNSVMIAPGYMSVYDTNKEELNWAEIPAGVITNFTFSFQKII